MLLRPRLSPAQAPLLTMLAGVSAHRRFGADGISAGVEVAERPVAEWKKLGGILTEMHAEPSAGAICDCGHRD